MSSGIPPSGQGCLSTIKDYGTTFTTLLGCSDQEPPTEESLKKEFYAVLGVGMVSLAVLVMGTIGQLGLLLGGTLATVMTISGTAGLLLTFYTGYRHWKRVSLFEGEKASGASPEEVRKAAASHLASRLDSVRNQIPV